jgi:hypothetical protein
MSTKTLRAAFLCLSLPVTLFAQQEPEGEEHPRNHAAAFIGATTSTERDETDFTLGGDYLRHLGGRWSIGAFAEAIFADHTNWILGPQIRWHVRGGFWLAAEPAVELAVEEAEEEHEPEREARAIFRIGTGYEFELGRWSVEPNLSVDVSKEKPSWVWGISIGTGFGAGEP